MPHIFVNGRFLTRPVTGVERFAHEILDELHDQGSVDGGSGLRWHILAPPGTQRPEKWKNFHFETVGKRGGHIWEQTDFYWASRGGISINLCNSGPVFHSRSVTVLHDAAVYDYPANFSFLYRTVHRRLGHLLARKSAIVTVSAFSRGRLAEILKLDPASVPVVANAADHVDAIVADDSIVDRLGLARGGYLLFVGSFAPNKNLRRTVGAFRRIGGDGDRLVMVGAQSRSFAKNDIADVPAGVVLPGRVNDPELAGLYRGAAALIFPSLYEGFGIPPLEAMRHGCPVIASTEPALKEVCADAALYCDPRDEDSIGGAMRQMLDDPDLRARLSEAGRLQAARYSWSSSAQRLSALVGGLAAGGAGA